MAGCLYRTFFQARHGGCGHRSCLAAHFTPDELGRDQPSEYWEKLMGLRDAATWQGAISGKLSRYAFYARKPYHKIIEHVCGHEDWNLDDVAACAGIKSKDTASKYTAQAFDALISAIDSLSTEWEEENNRYSEAKAHCWKANTDIEG